MWSKSRIRGLLLVAFVAANQALPAKAQTTSTDEVECSSPAFSHSPMRPLPVASNRERSEGPAYFVDPVAGNDANNGSAVSPWRTLEASIPNLQPGDVLYLREGVYYESITINLAFDRREPITIRSYPGELAIIDAGIREFLETPKDNWEPVPKGHPDEYRSTRVLSRVLDRNAAYHIGGITTGKLSGNFGDSMVPLFRYGSFLDLRSENELWGADAADLEDTGVYAGPGLRYDSSTGRIHVRLSHTNIDPLADNNYGGQTDPRCIPLIIPAHARTVDIHEAKHIRLYDVVLRGGDLEALRIADSEDIEIEGVTLYGGLFALRVLDDEENHAIAPRDIRISGSAIRGYAAPWHGRLHHKERTEHGALVRIGNRNDVIDNVLIEYSELTDHHDGLQIDALENGTIHGNLFDNFNDDGIDVGGLRKAGVRHISGNLISRCYQCLTTHRGRPTAFETGSGNYIYRNVFDLRRGVYLRPPRPDEVSQGTDYRGFARQSQIIGDHGHPVWAIYFVYHNNFIRRTPIANGHYAFEWSTGTSRVPMRVFNNIFVQLEGQIRVNPPDATHDFDAGNNLFWSVEEPPPEDEAYPGDVHADPRFLTPPYSLTRPPDFGLQSSSHARDAGAMLDASWPDIDRLRGADKGIPDIGALPFGIKWEAPGLAD